MKTETVLIAGAVVVVGVALWMKTEADRKAAATKAQQQKPDLMGQVSGFLGGSTQLLTAGSGLASSTAGLMDKLSSLFGSSSGATAAGSPIDDRATAGVTYA